MSANNKSSPSGTEDSGTENSGTEDSNESLDSKTARKREAERLQKLGRRLGEMRIEHLETLDLPASLHAALLDYQRFPSRGAKRRQLQFIGKVMRDEDTTAIEDQLATLDGESAQARYQFSQLEQWRDRLLSDPRALTEFIAEYPSVDRQQLRQLVKKTTSAFSNQQQDQQQKTLTRQLFRFLRDAANQESDQETK